MTCYQIKIECESGFEVLDIEAKSQPEALIALAKMLKAKARNGLHRTVKAISFERESLQLSFRRVPAEARDNASPEVAKCM